MTQTAKSPELPRLLFDQNNYRGGVGQTVFAIVLPLRYLEGANYKMSTVYHKPTPILQVARFQSRFKSGVKQDYVTWGKLLFVQYGKSRRTQIMTCGFISLIDVVHRHVAKLFLIQIETRPELYGITECSHYRS